MVRALADGLKLELMKENTPENLIKVAVSLSELLLILSSICCSKTTVVTKSHIH